MKNTNYLKRLKIDCINILNIIKIFLQLVTAFFVALGNENYSSMAECKYLENEINCIRNKSFKNHIIFIGFVECTEQKKLAISAQGFKWIVNVILRLLGIIAMMVYFKSRQYTFMQIIINIL